MSENVFKILVKIQSELKAPKNQYNSFGGYNYRSCEDIVEAVKPLLKETETVLLFEDSVELIGERYYIKAKVTLMDVNGQSVSAVAYAREADKLTGQQPSQITGTTSSYARKYALNALFAIDDTKDADYMDNREKGKSKQSKPSVKLATGEQVKCCKEAIEKLETDENTVVDTINKKMGTKAKTLKDYSEKQMQEIISFLNVKIQKKSA